MKSLISGDNRRIFFHSPPDIYRHNLISNIDGDEIMNNELVPEFYDNEWDIRDAKPRKSSYRDPTEERTENAIEEYNKLALFLASVGARVSGYLSH